jgi:hypothetical protein
MVHVFDSYLRECVNNKIESPILSNYNDTPLGKKLSMQVLIKNFMETGQETFDEFMVYCSTALTAENIEKVKEITINQSKDPAWYHLKYARISASKIFEVARCQTPDGCLVEKLLGSKTLVTAAMKRGLDVERGVLRETEKLLNIKIEKSGLVLSNQFPLFGASPAIGRVE